MRLSSKKCHIFDLVKIRKFKMWGGGIYLGGFQDPKMDPKKMCFWNNHCGETL